MDLNVIISVVYHFQHAIKETVTGIQGADVDDVIREKRIMKRSVDQDHHHISARRVNPGGNYVGNLEV